MEHEGTFADVLILGFVMWGWRAASGVPSQSIRRVVPPRHCRLVCRSGARRSSRTRGTTARTLYRHSQQQLVSQVCWLASLF